MGGLRRWAALVCLLAVAGCATRWEKPGATAADFGAMTARCESRAYSRIRPAMQQVQVGSGYFTPLQTRCVDYGYTARCFQVGGEYVPPSFATIDNNADARAADVKACFFENGWSPVKDR